MEWIRLVAPDLIAFHVPNGGFRTKAEAARMKWVGVLAGVPDSSSWAWTADVG